MREIELPERRCLCRTIKAGDGVHPLRAIGKFYDEPIRGGVPISRVWPEFCEYPDEGLLKGEFPTTDFTIRVCLPVDKKSAPSEAVRYPAGRTLAVNYRGGYYDLWRAYAALSQAMDETGYTPAGYPQEIYLEIEADGSVKLDEAHNITRVIVPVKRIDG